MTSMQFINSTCDMNEMWFDSHKNLIISVCQELDSLPKAKELIEKLLDKPMKLKKLKDTHRPKKGKSAFLYFCDDKRESVAEKYEKYNVGVVAKDLGVLWAKCKNRKKYNDSAEQDKERYRNEMEEFNEAMKQYS